jgi:hypothetical protein
MRTLQELDGQELTWRRRGILKRAYELRADVDVCATLHWNSFDYSYD